MKLTTTAYVHLREEANSLDELTVFGFDASKSSSGYILLYTATIEFEVDETNVRVDWAKELVEHAEKIRAQAEMEARRLEEHSHKVLGLPSPRTIDITTIEVEEE